MVNLDLANLLLFFKVIAAIIGFVLLIIAIICAVIMLVAAHMERKYPHLTDYNNDNDVEDIENE